MKNINILVVPAVVFLLSSTGFGLDQSNSSDGSSQTNQTINVNSCCEEPKPLSSPCKECEICPPCEPCKPCCTELPKTGEPCNCAYNAPARIDPACGWDGWLSLSFIYWQPKESGLNIGYHQYVTSGLIHFEPIQLDFDYKPGFKIGAGMSICRDDWTIYVEYTRLTGEDRRSFNLGDDFNVSTNYLVGILEKIPTSNFLKYINGKWNINYNIFDLDLGRPYYLGRKLVFKPFYGLRAGWIDQKLVLHSQGIHEGQISVNSGSSTEDTWLVGPRIGVDTDWLIGCHFKLLGNAAASLCYQNFDTVVKSTVQASSGEAKEELSSLTPNMDFALGIGYGSYFWNNEWYFDLSCVYDFICYWNQNMIKPLKDAATFQSESEHGNLILHGLTIKATLDF